MTDLEALLEIWENSVPKMVFPGDSLVLKLLTERGPMSGFMLLSVIEGICGDLGYGVLAGVLLGLKKNGRIFHRDGAWRMCIR